MTQHTDMGGLVERLRELLQACPALPIAARPQEHDDWGMIRSLSRDERGFQMVFATAESGRFDTVEELNEHRRNNTDPTQATMDLIVEGLNALPLLLDAIEALSIPQGLGEEK